MIRVTAVSKKEQKLYAGLVKKEVELAKAKRGTLFRSGKKQRGYAKWAHVKFDGWIWLQECLGGVVVAEIQSRTTQGESQLMESFVGFLDRHFKDDIASISIHYEEA